MNQWHLFRQRIMFYCVSLLCTNSCNELFVSEVGLNWSSRSVSNISTEGGSTLAPGTILVLQPRNNP